MGNLVGCKPPPAAAAMFLEVKFGGRRVEACGLYTFFTLIELVLLDEAILVRELIVPPSLLLVAEEGLEPEPVFLPPLRWHDLVPQSLTLRLPSSVATATEAVFSTSAVAVMKKKIYRVRKLKIQDFKNGCTFKGTRFNSYFKVISLSYIFRKLITKTKALFVFQTDFSFRLPCKIKNRSC